MSNHDDDRDDFDVIFGNLIGALLISVLLVVLFSILGWPRDAVGWGCTFAGVGGGYALHWLRR